MKLSTKTVIQGLMFTTPIAFSCAIAVAPSQAASVARSSGKLVLENFTWDGNPDSLGSDTKTFTNAVAPANGAQANANADAKAEATPHQLNQFSKADAKGSGKDYFAIGKSSSDTGIGFDTQCGCFRFDFKAALSAIARATEPQEIASAGSFVAFYIFNNADLSAPIDFLEATLSANNPLSVVLSSNALNITSEYDHRGKAGFAGYYHRHFDEGTQLTVRGVTRSDAVAARVPAPPMLAGLVIMPGLAWMKRRKLKAMPQEVAATNHQSE